MTTDFISSIAGVLLSIIFSYIPGVATWYNSLNSDYKRLVMFASLLLVTGGVLVSQCATAAGWQCSQNTVIEAFRVFVMALIANQSTDRISPFIGEKKRGEYAELSQL